MGGGLRDSHVSGLFTWERRLSLLGRGPHWSAMSSQVAYRLGDGAPVGFESARAIWTAVAREVLEETPSSASVAHSELARQVQQRSGVYTRMPVADWLPASLPTSATPGSPRGYGSTLRARPPARRGQRPRGRAPSPDHPSARRRRPPSAPPASCNCRPAADVTPAHRQRQHEGGRRGSAPLSTTSLWILSP